MEVTPASGMRHSVSFKLLKQHFCILNLPMLTNADSFSAGSPLLIKFLEKPYRSSYSICSLLLKRAMTVSQTMLLCRDFLMPYRFILSLWQNSGFLNKTWLQLSSQSNLPLGFPIVKRSPRPEILKLLKLKTRCVCLWWSIYLHTSKSLILFKLCREKILVPRYTIMEINTEVLLNKNRYRNSIITLD